MNSNAVKSLCLGLVVSSVESLAPDGAYSGRSAFGPNSQSMMQPPPMQPGYGSADMALQNNFYGIPSYGQPDMGFGFDDHEDFGMPSFGGMGMGGGYGYGGGMEDGFGNGGMPPMGRGFLPDQDTGINAGLGGSDIGPRSSRSVSRSMQNGSAPRSCYGREEFYDDGPGFHHGMGRPRDFPQDMDFGMPPPRFEEGMDRYYGGGRSRQGWRSSNGMGYSQSGRSNIDMDTRYRRPGGRSTTGDYQRPLRPNF